MITEETARRIWACHKEIANSRALITHVQEELQKDLDREKDPVHRGTEPRTPRNTIEMGIPMFEGSGHRIYRVAPELSVKVIEAHIREQEARLKELMIIAKGELTTSDN